MEAIDVVLHPHVKSGGDRALLFVASDMEVPVGSAIGQPMDERRIAVEAEYDRLVLGKEGVVVGFAQSMRMLCARLQSHEIDDIDHPNSQSGQMFAQDGYRGQNLERRRVAAASHHDVRF